MRVNVKVINASDGAQVGSRRLERPLAELFELQDELVTRTVAWE